MSKFDFESLVPKLNPEPAVPKFDFESLVPKLNPEPAVPKFDFESLVPKLNVSGILKPAMPEFNIPRIDHSWPFPPSPSSQEELEAAIRALQERLEKGNDRKIVRSGIGFMIAILSILCPPQFSIILKAAQATMHGIDFFSAIEQKLKPKWK